MLTFKGDNLPIFSFEKINVGFFLGTSEAKSFKICLIRTLLGVYFIVDLLILTLLQGHRYVRNINCKLRVLYSCPR